MPSTEKLWPLIPGRIPAVAATVSVWVVMAKMGRRLTNRASSHLAPEAELSYVTTSPLVGCIFDLSYVALRQLVGGIMARGGETATPPVIL